MKRGSHQTIPITFFKRRLAWKRIVKRVTPEGNSVKTVGGFSEGIQGSHGGGKKKEGNAGIEFH